MAPCVSSAIRLVSCVSFSVSSFAVVFLAFPFLSFSLVAPEKRAVRLLASSICSASVSFFLPILFSKRFPLGSLYCAYCFQLCLSCSLLIYSNDTPTESNSLNPMANSDLTNRNQLNYTRNKFWSVFVSNDKCALWCPGHAFPKDASFALFPCPAIARGVRVSEVSRGAQTGTVVDSFLHDYSPASARRPQRRVHLLSSSCIIQGACLILLPSRTKDPILSYPIRSVSCLLLLQCNTKYYSRKRDSTGTVVYSPAVPSCTTVWILIQIRCILL